MCDHEFEHRLATALRSDPTGIAGSAARARIMERVRSLPAGARPHRRPHLATIRTRHSIVGLVLAAGIGSITTLTQLMPQPGTAPSDLASGVIGDTVGATLRDTLRLVRLIFDDSAARRVVAVGDFNDWRADVTPLHLDSASRRWSATIALRDGVVRYAFVVDGTRWAVDPSAELVRDENGRLYSRLHVGSATN